MNSQRFLMRKTHGEASALRCERVGGPHRTSKSRGRRFDFRLQVAAPCEDLSAERFWLPAVRAAGLEPLRIHDLRHTAIAFWIAVCADPKRIAVRAGHSSVAVVLNIIRRSGKDRYNAVSLTLFDRPDAAQAWDLFVDQLVKACDDLSHGVRMLLPQSR